MGCLKEFDKGFFVKVRLRRKALYPISVPFSRTLEVPEPVLTSIGKNYKRRFPVCRIAAGLFFGIIGVQILALRLKNTKGTANTVFQDIIGAARWSVVFENHLTFLWVQKIPTTVRKGFINKNPGKGFGMVCAAFRGFFRAYHLPLLSSPL
jgi:hypothetical protein